MVSQDRPGHGIVTPSLLDCTETFSHLHLPLDLRGQSVLDIGAWDGYYSFAAERQGAGRVLATDHLCWGGEGWGTQDGFNLARQALNSKVEDLEIDVLDHSPEKVGFSTSCSFWTCCTTCAIHC